MTGEARWVFGYGSLMWRPGFAFEESRPARIHGHHRALCVISHHYRGTHERPGLVLGLDRGGSCQGVAFRVAAGAWEATHAYLRGRELVTDVYHEVHPVAHLAGGLSVRALSYVVDRAHGQYAGKLDASEQLAFVRQGIGVTGSCRDYVEQTLRHLRELGIRDAGLEALAALL